MTTQESCFYSRHVKLSRSCKTPRTAVRFIQSTIQSQNETFTPSKTGRDMRLTTYPPLIAGVTEFLDYTSTPPYVFMACTGTTFPLPCLTEDTVVRILCNSPKSVKQNIQCVARTIRNTQTHKRMVGFQKLTRHLFLTLHGHNVHRQLRQLSKFLMRASFLNRARNSRCTVITGLDT